MEEPTPQKTILVVDDEDGVRESVREVLTDEGYRVVDTGDGTRVLKMIREEKPSWSCSISGCLIAMASVCSRNGATAAS